MISIFKITDFQPCSQKMHYLIFWFLLLTLGAPNITIVVFFHQQKYFINNMIFDIFLGLLHYTYYIKKNSVSLN